MYENRQPARKSKSFWHGIRVKVTSFTQTNTLILVFWCFPIQPFRGTFLKTKQTQNYTHFPLFSITHTRIWTIFFRGRPFTSKQILLFSASVWNYFIMEKNECEQQKKCIKRNERREKNKKTQWNHQCLHNCVLLRAQRPKFWSIHLGNQECRQQILWSYFICQWNAFAIVLKWTYAVNSIEFNKCVSIVNCCC